MIINARINKLPYFLLSTQAVEVQIDKENNTATFEGRTSELHKVSIYEIFFMKHLPMIIITGLMFYIPELIHIAIGLTAFLIGYAILHYMPRQFKKFLVLIALSGFYIVPNDLEILFEHSLYVTVMFVLITYIARDIYNLKNNDLFYYLDDIDTAVNIKGTKTRPGKKKLFGIIPFFGLTAKKETVSLANFSIGGYYLKLNRWELEDV